MSIFVRRKFTGFHKLLLMPAFVFSVSIVWYFVYYQDSFKRLWISADQQAFLLYQKGKYQQAALIFEDADFKGSAFFKAGEFKKSVAMYSTLSDASARFNLANSYLMLGKYKDAITFYDLALKIQPDFVQAAENKTIAELMQAKIEAQKNNDEGTGGQLAADEIVYDNKGNHGQDVVEQGEGKDSKNTHWLDRLQTGPKEFLQHKFAYQYAQQQSTVSRTDEH